MPRQLLQLLCARVPNRCHLQERLADILISSPFRERATLGSVFAIFFRLFQGAPPLFARADQNVQTIACFRQVRNWLQLAAGWNNQLLIDTRPKPCLTFGAGDTMIGTQGKTNR